MSKRHDDVFHVLKVIRRGLDETRDLLERLDPAADRTLADALRDAPAAAAAGPPGSLTMENLGAVLKLLVTSGPARFHTLCVRLIDERETLAMELNRIGRDLDNAGIESRTHNLGEEARSNTTSPPTPQPPAAKARPKPRRKR